jgi:phosphatidate cytidylyltransferase
MLKIKEFFKKYLGILPEELRKRIVISVILIPLAIVIIYSPQQIFDVSMIVNAILMGFEWVIITKDSENPEKWNLIGLLYILSPCVSLIYLKGRSSNLVMYVMLICWVTDTAGFFIGKMFGGPKLAPTISPKKTWSGLIGGVVASMLLGVLFSFAFKSDVKCFMFLSGFLAVVEAMGDLLESKIKRTFSVKDSGTLIPGHGGILDRIDGLTLLAPLVALLVLFSNNIF